MFSEDRLHARATYQGLAAHYDRLTAGYDHESWVSRLLELTGADRRRVLDVACGTGRSSAPLLGHGYDVNACDLSPAMLQVAHRRLKLGDRRVFLADMRALPDCGSYDLITCLDDAVNYLTGPGELSMLFAGVARLLAPSGVFVFDTNSITTYRRAFAGVHDVGAGRSQMRWRGLGSCDAAPGSESTAAVEAMVDGAMSVIATHRQRHHPVEDVVERLAGAGLVAERVVGQRTGCRIDRRVDELSQTKTVFVARRAPAERPGR